MTKQRPDSSFGGDRPDPAAADGQRAYLTTLWALALARFRDYVHWAAELASDLRAHPGGPHDLDP